VPLEGNDFSPVLIENSVPVASCINFEFGGILFAPIDVESLGEVEVKSRVAHERCRIRSEGKDGGGFFLAVTFPFGIAMCASATQHRTLFNGAA
jgi:hypothetical protein